MLCCDVHVVAKGPPHLHHFHHTYAVVEVDLTAPNFKPGKPNYDRVQWCLSGRLGLKADFTIAWTPKGLATSLVVIVATSICTTQVILNALATHLAAIQYVSAFPLL